MTKYPKKQIMAVKNKNDDLTATTTIFREFRDCFFGGNREP
jgi:hypothetical protein